MSIKQISFSLFAFLAIAIGLYPLAYLYIDDSQGLLSTKSIELLSSQVWRLSFYIHIAFGGIALLTGWSQFSAKLRLKRLPLHRKLGKVYLVSVGLSGLTALYIAQYASEGIISITGFTILAILWLWTTTKAYQSVRVGNIAGHQRWMIRSYALTFAAVTLRIWLPLLVMAFKGDFSPAYQIVAWLAWVPNIFVAEWLIGKSKVVLT